MIHRKVGLKQLSETAARLLNARPADIHPVEREISEYAERWKMRWELINKEFSAEEFAEEIKLRARVTEASLETSLILQDELEWRKWHELRSGNENILALN
jgi:hypothetical protein